MPFTARAFAHERKHSSILKLMETTKYETVMRENLTAAQQNVEARAKTKSVQGARAAARGEKLKRKPKPRERND
jgi:adenine deaminase